MANTYPPKFDQSIRYPALQNLDELPMPQSDYPLGVYFNITFPGYPTNTIPPLGFGKHKFDIDIVPMNATYTTEGYNIGSDYPMLQNKSRILFEFKDVDKNVIFSDYTPISKDSGFTGYLWIKQDPLRTYENIKEGTAELNIVGMTQTSNLEWRNRYNTRTSKNFTIDLFNSQGVVNKNESPIMMQFTTSSMGSGSGLTCVENLLDDNTDPSIALSFLNISASKMKTYSGQISRVTSYIKISGSADYPDWEQFGDYPLSSSIYEDDIDANYSEGINTLSEQWDQQIKQEYFTEENTNKKVKFKFQFLNPFGESAKNYENISEEFTLYYPNIIDDANPNGWMEIQGGIQVMSNNITIPPLQGVTVARTANGQFSFDSLSPTPGAPIGGGQKFGNNGRLFEYGGGGQDSQGRATQ